MGINFLLVNLKYPENIGRIIRTNKVMSKDSKLFIYDPKNLYIKKYKDIKLTSVEISEELKPTMVKDIYKFLKEYPGRVIATGFSKKATLLNKFRFRDSDLILLGNEHEGLPKKLFQYCQSSIIIPMFGTPFKIPKKFASFRGEKSLSLNVSIAHSIIAYCASVQLYDIGEFRHFGG